MEVGCRTEGRDGGSVDVNRVLDGSLVMLTSFKEYLAIEALCKRLLRGQRG
jgi:hypothetical protein